MSFANEAIKWVSVLKSLSELFKIKIEVHCAHVSVLYMFLFVPPFTSISCHAKIPIIWRLTLLLYTDRNPFKTSINWNSTDYFYKILNTRYLSKSKFDWLNECISACQCSSAGSLHTACHLTTGKCSCKDNVEGHNCDSCKDGTYNLDVANPQGCLHCFGYGRALTCKSAEGFVASNTTSNFFNETGIY